MGKSEMTFEIFTKNYSKIIQALSISHAMSKFKDLSDDEIIGVWNVKYNSHSPTELNLPKMTEEKRNSLVLQVDDYDLFDDLPEFDTLQNGDWFEGTEEDYRRMLKLLTEEPYDQYIDDYVILACRNGFMAYEGNSVLVWYDEAKKKQLTTPEFLRRAENTFKNKKS